MTLSGLLNAEYDFSAILDWIKSLFIYVTTGTAFSDIWGPFSAFASAIPAFLVALMLLAVALLQMKFGNNLLGVHKFLGTFFLGFVVGAAFLAELIPDFLGISPVIIGIVVGTLVGLVCKLVYIVVYAAFIGYGVYMIMMGGYFLPDFISDFTKDNMAVSLIAVILTVTLSLLLIKIIETAGTATFVACCTWFAFMKLFASFGLVFGGAAAAVIKILAIGTMAITFYVKQDKTQKRRN